MRLFIAAFLPEEIVQEAVNAQEFLKTKTDINAKLSKKENLHITLAYIGQVDSNQKDNIIEKLNKIKFKTAEAHLSHIDISKRKNSPMIWIRVLGDELEKLAHKIRVELLDYLIKDLKPFWGHITIARIKENLNPEELQRFIKNTKINKIKFNINDFYLVESKLHSDGPEYIKLKCFKQS